MLGTMVYFVLPRTHIILLSLHSLLFLPFYQCTYFLYCLPCGICKFSSQAKNTSKYTNENYVQLFFFPFLPFPKQREREDSEQTYVSISSINPRVYFVFNVVETTNHDDDLILYLCSSKHTENRARGAAEGSTQHASFTLCNVVAQGFT